jgi:hypothetical protein
MKLKSIKEKFFIFFICYVFLILVASLSGCSGISAIDSVIDDLVDTDLQTGNVHIKVGDIFLQNKSFKIYIDGVYQATTDVNGNLTVTNVPVGNHKFEASNNSSWAYYGSKTQNIKTGNNNVYIDVVPINNPESEPEETTGKVSVMLFAQTTATYYDIFLDGVYKGKTKWILDLGDVSVGTHTFKAVETNPVGLPKWGETIQKINPGEQYVNITIKEMIVK